jgi:cell division protein FtsA
MLKGRTSGRKLAGITGALDIGSAKICCLIWQHAESGAKTQTDRRPHLIGFGLQRSAGITAGLVTNLAEAERAVRGAVAQAERMAGVLLEDIVVGVTAGRIWSRRFAARTLLERGTVARADLDKVTSAARGFASRDGRTVLHLDALDLTLDEQSIAGSPLGLPGERLKADMHAVSTDTAALEPLQELVERCYLTPRFTPQALASGLAVARGDEREDGVIVIDIGAGTTTLAAFAQGRFVATGQIPLGGNHVTYDVQRRLQTPLAEAERIKTLYGSLIAAPSYDLERVSYPVEIEGEREVLSISRAELRHLLEPRMDALLLRVAEWRAALGARIGAASGCVVLTGGSSQLVGLDMFAANRLGVPVRVGVPLPETGVQSNLRLANYSAVIGLASAAECGIADPAEAASGTVLGSEYLGRVGSWLMKSF